MKKTKPVKVIIDRKKWSRGDLAYNALLVGRKTIEEGKAQFESGDSTGSIPKLGYMCCLGFVCLTLGVTVRAARNSPLPEDTNKLLEGLTEKDPYGGVRNSNFSQYAARINDDGAITEKERELKLKALAQKNGFIFQFIN